jgi:FkbH-like protein
MVRVDLPVAVNSYLLKIRFKRWGKLWTPGTVRLHSAANAARVEKRDYRIGKALQHLPLPSLVKITAAKKRYDYKKKTVGFMSAGRQLPTCFLLECHNPEHRKIQMSLTMRSTDGHSKIPFQKLLEVTPGFHRFRVPLEDITATLDVLRPFDIEIVPNGENETTLYFGLMEFLVEVAEEEEPGEKKVKCVVWDLDNTIWEGILVEDGIEQLRLKSGIVDVIRTLDERGILHSVVSKNNAEAACEAIKRFHLDEYFLYPQISWQPKSRGLQAIAKQLNIGLDSILFLDDTKFELEEVKSVCRDVKTLNAEEYRGLPSRSDCNVPITAESKDRRKLYQVEMKRQTMVEGFSGDYMAFLRHCEIRLRIQPMTAANLERVHELTQRTNQMNFSGNRYDRDVLRELLANRHMDTFVLSCEDRFGMYGVVGFSIIDRREPRMTDLMFSCRIQSKRVEHAFLAHAIRKYIAETGSDFYANYRKTPRNEQAGRVFVDLSMEEVENKGGIILLKFPKGREVPDDSIIKITAQETQVEELA